jgi:GcrA cell cycle regulator
MSKSTKKQAKPTVKTMANLEARDCRWPIGDPRQDGFHFCGAPRMPGRPYCELHWRLSLQPERVRGSQAETVPAPRKAA